MDVLKVMGRRLDAQMEIVSTYFSKVMGFVSQRLATALKFLM